MKALSDVVMLDLTHMLSGPYGAQLLTDLGVQAIKVEPPGKGEGTRALQAKDPRNSRHGMGSYFLTLNRSKKSVAIDLKNPEGLALFNDLVKKADVVMDNFSAGVTARLKIDHATLAKINPRIITCTVTGFGETGPGKDRPAFDMVAQATGGGMSITGTPDHGPYRAGIPIGDLGGGIMGCIGILSALHQRERTGRGQHVDVSMLDAQISMLNYMATMYFLSGETPYGIGNSHFVHVPYDNFKTKTRPIILAIITDNFWEALSQMLGDRDLIKPEYATQPARFKDKEFINGRVAKILATDTAEVWMEKLRAARIPHAPVNDFAHALSDEQVLARGMVVAVPDGKGGTVKMPGNPIKLSDHEDSFAPPPTVGQHTGEVLRAMLGRSDEDIEKLRAAGAIG
ncbi:MAG: CoA transferase [Alphaproteobacteria bacterium]|nr:CoA transferase [Alphaproteobacteria bacterium]